MVAWFVARKTLSMAVAASFFATKCLNLVMERSVQERAIVVQADLEKALWRVWVAQHLFRGSTSSTVVQVKRANAWRRREWWCG
ncbi:DUF2169 domain-containing protein [Sesbania bispinosa]|nr:DUF2169 domain-containing protein [Sesbania bispinosa]